MKNFWHKVTTTPYIRVRGLRVKNLIWNPYYAFIADDRHVKYGLTPGVEYCARQNRHGRTISRPIRLGHTPTLQEKLASMVPFRYGDEAPRSELIVIDMVIAFYFLTIFAVVVIAFATS